jgi:hypothetical protein
MRLCCGDIVPSAYTTAYCHFMCAYNVQTIMQDLGRHAGYAPGSIPQQEVLLN